MDEGREAVQRRSGTSRDFRERPAQLSRGGGPVTRASGPVNVGQPIRLRTRILAVQPAESRLAATIGRPTLIELPRAEPVLMLRHIDALAAEAHPFHLQARPLFQRGLPLQLDLAARAYDALPGQPA